jgi:methionyl-tRNA formyltransferase
MGNRLGFCLAHAVDRGVDTGPIVAMEEFLYPSSCRIPIDFERVSNERNEAFLWGLVESVRDRSREFVALPQPEYLSTYWPRLHTDTHAWIDWRLPAELLDRFVCAFDDPYPGARTTWRGRTIRLKRSMLDHSDGGAFHPVQAGLIYRTNGRWLCIAANGATLIVETVVDDAGNSLMDEIGVGERLTTPQTRLDETAQRVTYDPLGPKFSGRAEGP